MNVGRLFESDLALAPRLAGLHRWYGLVGRLHERTVSCVSTFAGRQLCSLVKVAFIAVLQLELER